MCSNNNHTVPTGREYTLAHIEYLFPCSFFLFVALSKELFLEIFSPLQLHSAHTEKHSNSSRAICSSNVCCSVCFALSSWRFPTIRWVGWNAFFGKSVQRFERWPVGWTVAVGRISFNFCWQFVGAWTVKKLSRAVKPRWTTTYRRSMLRVTELVAARFAASSFRTSCCPCVASSEKKSNLNYENKTKNGGRKMTKARAWKWVLYDKLS